ncbi:hypothetical protein [Priestia megaterium]|uniref:hypothetical protein n=1 Tax=Priestia megaterium TaxID=1404 RepID=UPI003100D1D6
MKLPSKIGFSGKMTAGKTTISNLLANEYGYVVLPIGGRIKKVSNLLIEDRIELKKYLLDILPKENANKALMSVEVVLGDLEELYESHFASSVSLHGVHNVFIKDHNGVYQKNDYYRDLTQKVGSKVRATFGEDVWVQILLNEAELLIKQGKKVICDDIRLEVEYDLFNKQNYTLIRLDVDPEVQRNRILDLYKTYNDEALTHPTEIALDNTYFKYRFDTSVDSVNTTFNKIDSLIKGGLV